MIVGCKILSHLSRRFGSQSQHCFAGKMLRWQWLWRQMLPTFMYI